jgi:hypothetical protein
MGYGYCVQRHFQQYFSYDGDGQFYWWRKAEQPSLSQVIVKLYHVMRHYQEMSVVARRGTIALFLQFVIDYHILKLSQRL